MKVMKKRVTTPKFTNAKPKHNVSCNLNYVCFCVYKFCLKLNLHGARGKKIGKNVVKCDYFWPDSASGLMLKDGAVGFDLETTEIFFGDLVVVCFPDEGD